MLVKRAESLFLKIAGITLGFRSDSPGIIRILRRRYAPFLVRGGVKKERTFFEVSVVNGVNLPFRPLVEQKKGGLSFKRGDFRASLELTTGRGVLAAAANEQCLDAFLRTLMSSLLARSGGLLLHSAGVVKRGKAYLFPGVSGAGKSTLSRLASAAGYEVISDEIVPLRMERGRFFVYGSPFWGEMRSAGRPLRLPLAGVYILRKSRSASVRPVSAEEFVPLFMRCCLNFSRDPAAAAGLLSTVSALSRLPARELGFSKKDASFIGLLK